MNKRIGEVAAAVNLAAVVGFAISMLLNSVSASYLTSIGIAFSFVVLISAFAYFGNENTRVAGLSALAFAAMYALCNLIVYFTQVTTVSHQSLNAQAAALLDYRQFGLMFNWDMLGYCLMAVSTFFIGLTIEADTKADRWLKYLLLVHGVFAIGCFVMPMLGLFTAGMAGGDWIGTAILLFWCAYFAPIGVLSIIHFSKKS